MYVSSVSADVIRAVLGELRKLPQEWPAAKKEEEVKSKFPEVPPTVLMRWSRVCGKLSDEAIELCLSGQIGRDKLFEISSAEIPEVYRNDLVFKAVKYDLTLKEIRRCRDLINGGRVPDEVVKIVRKEVPEKKMDKMELLSVDTLIERIQRSSLDTAALFEMLKKMGSFQKAKGRHLVVSAVEAMMRLRATGLMIIGYVDEVTKDLPEELVTRITAEFMPAHAAPPEEPEAGDPAPIEALPSPDTK